MKNQELITYIQFNIKDIYNNLTIVFGLENKEIKLLFTNLISSFRYNKKLIKKECSTNIFSLDRLTELKRSLNELGLTDDEIRKIIVKSPIIILYSDRLNDIYYLYKNKKYYGYTVLDNEEYDTYLLNNNLDSNIISNNYITKKMLEYYKIRNYGNREFDNIEKDFKLKNYYFKRKGKKANFNKKN